MEFKASTPDHIRGITYRKNHHWIELTDDEGNVTKLNATGIVMYACKTTGCKFKMFIPQETDAKGQSVIANHGNLPCALCGTWMKPTWIKPQLSFLPEGESAFKGPLDKK